MGKKMWPSPNQMCASVATEKFFSTQQRVTLFCCACKDVLLLLYFVLTSEQNSFLVVH